jgi:hypothetical protein
MANNIYVDLPQSYTNKKQDKDIFTADDIRNKLLKAIIKGLDKEDTKEIYYNTVGDVFAVTPTIYDIKARKQHYIEHYKIELAESEELFIDENIVSMKEVECEEYTIGLHDEILIIKGDTARLFKVINEHYLKDNIIFDYKDSTYDRGDKFTFFDKEAVNKELRKIHYKDYLGISQAILFYWKFFNINLGTVLDYENTISDIDVLTNSDGKLYNKWMNAKINQLPQNAFITDYSKVSHFD